MSSQDTAPPEPEISHDDDLFKPGHRACAGCGPALAMRYITEATGENTIISHATGCMEVVSSPYPESSWDVSWIHDVFANAPGVASGVEAAYRAFDEKEGFEEFEDHDDVNFVAIGGDGATFDIGMRSLSGMMERGHDVLYIAYDNEGYMNTGIQRSSSTPFGASTTTSPAGSESFGNDTQKKNMPAIAADHGCEYVATASIAYPTDFKRKIEKALEHDGAKYIQVSAPCMLGWDFDSAETVNVAKLAVQTGMQPLFEIVDGELSDVMSLSDRKPVEEYLETQGRFAHLFSKEGGDEVIEEIQEHIDEQAEELGLDR
ncbi:thiamine pyrophosphate-dependent enzyme [Halanaeroarchaeum sulfurireducens]|uniref:Pyruvate:ferredoxin oxidoreductase, beta subunit n=1 Tax=Halanaeroarchaeum sulfurireducens TaxID=1604004 RepID=A0A0F7P8C5_9EURY|nr:thiamine pyrophosphate-dependent enzyme [Halanaeroarchaeum sulfurireducens]AKH96992.1 pyruvate:ferredoxin oxidoreductase, beta subunit [Halanaeroarchaeum sulfurireducens]ALG81393.1 pyruvate:ferredoxin oxidoreductase, beta subunit [Halanaeroarchaeum sulfurireducens]